MKPLRERGIAWTQVAIGLAIAAILFAVARPQYGDYSHRSQIDEAIVLLQGARIESAVYRRNEGRWPVALEPLVKEREGRFTESLRITRGAGGTGEFEITATLRASGVHEKVAGRTVRVGSVDGGETWTCRAGTVEPKYLPGSCR